MRLSKGIPILLLIALIAVALMPAQSVSRAQDGGFKLADRIAEKVANGEQLVFRVSYHDVSNEFAPQIKAGVDQAAADLGVDAVMVGPVGPKAEEQVAELESLIEAGVDGLAISSVSTDALAPLIDAALAQGIPVVTFNTDNPSSQRLAFVGQDLVASGFTAGELLVSKMGDKGDVIITTLDAAAQWSIDRETGARNALGQYPGINILETVNTGTEPQEIYAAIENAMLANPSVTGILSLECCSTPAAGEYIKRNGLTNDVTLVGFDLLPQTLELVASGDVDATIGQAPERQGYEAVNLLYQAVHGEAIEGIDTGAEVVDISNIDKYLGGETAAPTFTLNPRIAEKVANGEQLVFRVSYHDVSNEFAPQIKAGVDQAAADLGVDAVMVGPVGPKAEEQVAELESLIEAGVDGLAISSVSTDALAPLIDAALAQGIPVVTFNTDNPSSQRLAFVGQDLVASGFTAGELLVSKMGDKGDVIITTLDAAAQWSIDRETGARNALGQYPGINILETVNTGTEPQEIYAAIENAMLANPSVTGILSLECCSTPAAGEYIKRNGLTNDVTLVGFDLLPQTLELVSSGDVDATIGQAPERQGYEAVNLLYQAVHGEAIEGIDTGAEVVDISNIADYLK